MDPQELTQQRAPAAPERLRAELSELARAANEHHLAKRHAECETVLRRVLEIDPNNASALHVLALTRQALGDPAQAIALMRRALAIDPGAAALHVALSVILHGAADHEGAIAASRRAIELSPDDATAHNSLGASLTSLGRATEAIAAYRRALAINANFYECWCNLGHAQQMLLRLDEAADSYRRALGIQYDYPPAQSAAGMLALLRGDFASGFTQFEWRWRLASMTPRDFTQPRWQGEPLAGKTILLHAEQGAGDNIQCLRFVPQVAALGGRLVLELPQALTHLATRLDGGGGIIVQGEPLPAFDVHCAFMSLPRVLGTTLATLPAQVPYLHADPAAIERWAGLLAGTGSGLKVGIAWAGNPRHAGDRRRSVALERLAPILDVTGVRFYSLQVGERAGDLARLPPDEIVDLSPRLTSFAETAAALAHLDLVIAVDTSVVHLAGALGRPCWVMLPYSPDWRWLLDREDSPWYPSLRLFRQPAPDDWDGVIARVAEALAARAAPRPRASQPDADALFAEGLRSVAGGQPAEAEAMARRVLDADPDHVRSLRLLGVLRQQAGDHRAAADLFARVAELAPDDAEAHYNLGTAVMALGRPEEAVARLRRAIARAPDHAKAHSNLGSALLALRRLSEAEDALRRALALAPDLPSTWNNLGTTLAEQGRLAEAIESYRRVTALMPEFAEGHLNLGLALQYSGQREEALAQFRRAGSLRADYAQAQLAEAFLLLLTGDFAHGLPQLEWRWRQPEHTPRNLGAPRWRGESLDGKTILLHAEQGSGDTLMLLRYAPLIVERGGRVIIEVPSGLQRLAQRLVGGPYTVVAAGQQLPHFDLHCPLMSLPLAFGTTVETIPASAPYLTAAPDAVARWRARFAAGAGMKVGIVWAGSPAYRNDALRSIALERLASLFDLPDTQWHSLQVGTRAADLARLPAARVIDHAASLTDFAETAAAITALDLVVAVDTAVAHLAGALGKPVWILLPYDPDWRWLLGRGDSPWYRTARLVRQEAPGDWDGVIAKVRAALLDCVERARGANGPTEPPTQVEAIELVEARRD
jgi:tetratricopeptide (TPR) repeat protein